MFARFASLTSGSSLLELLSLTTIIGIIAVCLVPMVSEHEERQRFELDHQNRLAINAAVEDWYARLGAWPAADLSDIGRDRRYFPDGLPLNPVTGAPYSLHAESKTAQ